MNGRPSLNEGIDCGVPQGSCLRSLLFLVNTNDLSNCYKTFDMAMYAGVQR